MQATTTPVSSTYFQYGSNVININASTDYRLSVSAYPDALYDPVYLEITVPYDNISTVFSICRVELLSVGSNLPCVDQRRVNESITYYSTYDRLILSFTLRVLLSLSLCLSVCVCLCRCVCVCICH